MAMFLTLLRFILIIPFTMCFFISTPWAMPLALAIFIIASLTDWLDGYVARARNEVSALGAALDPLADKMLTSAALVLLIQAQILTGVGVIGALIILLREVLVTGLRESVSIQGGSLPVTKIAKWKTTFQMVAIAGLIAITPGGVLGSDLLVLVTGLFWLAVVLTIWTGADYTLKAVQFLRSR